MQGRGALKKELVACLRAGRALRVPRARTKGLGKEFVTPEVMISQRFADADDRAVPDHWEGDLIIGLNRPAIGTLVERTTRYSMLLHLSSIEGHGEKSRVKYGPPTAGHGAQAVHNAIAEQITLPQPPERSLARDQGSEMSQHAEFTVAIGIPVYFCDPQRPRQRDTNENTNGLLRRYFPNRTGLACWTANALQAVAHTLNTRPRKT